MLSKYIFKSTCNSLIYLSKTRPFCLQRNRKHKLCMQLCEVGSLVTESFKFIIFPQQAIFCDENNSKLAIT